MRNRNILLSVVCAFSFITFKAPASQSSLPILGPRDVANRLQHISVDIIGTFNALKKISTMTAISWSQSLDELLQLAVATHNSIDRDIYVKAKGSSYIEVSALMRDQGLSLLGSRLIFQVDHADSYRVQGGGRRAYISGTLKVKGEPRFLGLVRPLIAHSIPFIAIYTLTGAKSVYGTQPPTVEFGVNRVANEIARFAHEEQIHSIKPPSSCSAIIE